MFDIFEILSYFIIALLLIVGFSTKRTIFSDSGIFFVGIFALISGLDVVKNEFNGNRIPYGLEKFLGLFILYLAFLALDAFMQRKSALQENNKEG